MAFKLKTRVFTLSEEKYQNKSELARAMGISLSQIRRVGKGTSDISEKFITGAIKAFPDKTLDELFYVASEESRDEVASEESRDEPASQTVKRNPAPQDQATRFKGMMTAREVADFFNIHINTVRRLSNQRVLKAYRINSRGDRRFRREDIDAFLEERRSG